MHNDRSPAGAWRSGVNGEIVGIAKLVHVLEQKRSFHRPGADGAPMQKRVSCDESESLVMMPPTDFSQLAIPGQYLIARGWLVTADQLVFTRCNRHGILQRSPADHFYADSSVGQPRNSQNREFFSFDRNLS